MRFLSAFLIALVATTVLAAPDTQTVTPHTCKLTSLTLGNGLTLTTDFDENSITRQFFCACLFEQDWTTVTVTPKESGAILKLTANGNPVTPFYANTESPAFPLIVGTNHIVVNVDCGTCNLDWKVDCDREPDNEPSTQGDPQFVGLRGQSYQIHGVAGDIYNIISDVNMQMNSKFVFLANGQCPIINGQVQTDSTCWTHPGQYLGEIGIQTIAGEQILLVAGAGDQGFQTVSINNQPLRVDTKHNLQNGYITRNGTHSVTVQVSSFTITFENSDMFVNQKLAVNDWTNMAAHGLLGQTWNQVIYPNRIKFIQGSVDDYRVDDGIFGTNFVFNKFQPQRK